MISSRSPSIEADVDEATTWAVIKTKYESFDYAALHWAHYFSDCTEAATEENKIPTLAICRADTTLFANWFKYFWYKNVQPEPFPAVVEALMIASYVGLVSVLLRLLRDPECMDPPSLTRALHWTARMCHDTCVQLLLQQRKRDPQGSAIKNQPPLLASARFGQVKCISMLLKDTRVEVNAQDSSGLPLCLWRLAIITPRLSYRYWHTTDWISTF